jgi:hypothetical protein
MFNGNHTISGDRITIKKNPIAEIIVVFDNLDQLHHITH